MCLFSSFILKPHEKIEYKAGVSQQWKHCLSKVLLLTLTDHEFWNSEEKLMWYFGELL